MAIMSSEVDDVLVQLGNEPVPVIGEESKIYQTFNMDISKAGGYPIRFGEFCSLWAVTQRGGEG